MQLAVTSTAKYHKKPYRLMQASVSLGWRLRWLDLVQVSGDLCERPAQDPVAVLQRREVVRRRDLPHRREVPVQRRLPRLLEKCK